jgi:ABC transporter substrate binding protein (PQQ-dependent alcohol dehydrogenase system)
MLTDSIAQYLIKKKWNKILMLTGPLDEDKILSNSFKQSSKKFGVKIIKENFFVNSNDPRVRDKNSLAFLTKGKKYNTVFVSDIDGEFALSIPNATMTPALVTGSSGLVAKAWHWSYLRHGAPQLNGRFERLNNRRMESKDWSAWVAIKTLVEAVLRVQSTNNDEIIEYITSDKLNLDGSKGISLSYKKKSNQLRQTILLTTSDNWVTIKAPLDDFQNNNNRLDTLGISPKDITCN